LAGTIIGDEAITDLEPNKGAELCTSTELMFSLSWIYQYLADNDIADWAELTAFNAFPGQIWSDWWSHQYVQQENQVSCSVHIQRPIAHRLSLAMVKESYGSSQDVG
jgi:hypothetical protein